MPAVGAQTSSGVGSAGSLVSAVMESAGYLAQSDILRWFEDFWKVGGAFIYMISVVGAVVSVAIFGSYAWGRYLLIAPVLFWFLTNTRQEIDFVTWKLGGAKANGVAHVIDQVMVDRDEKLRTELKQAGAGRPVIGADGTETYGKKANVSWFFHKTAKLSSAIVNGIVDQILYQETNDDLMLASKATILNFFLNAQPEDPETYQMFSEVYFVSCLKYTEAQMRFAQPRYAEVRKARVKEQIDKINADPNASASDRIFMATLQERFGELSREAADLEQEMHTLGKQRFPLPQSMQTFFSRMANGSRVNPLNPDINYAQAAQNLGAVQLSCKEMSDVVAHKFIEEGTHQIGKAFTDRFKETSTSDQDLAAKRQDLCLALAGKIHPLEEADKVTLDQSTGGKRECDLSETIAIFLMRQVLLQQDLSKNIQQIKNRVQFAPSEQEYIEVDLQNKVIDAKDPSKRMSEERFRELAMIQGNDVGIDRSGMVYIREKGGKIRTLISKPIKGLYSVFYGPAQAYATKEIKYDIFAGATKIPYFQGVLLYLVAATFPFLALLVLVPGHAQAFLNVPLVWFWLKSWDIGYACVIVMDKILWNLLPSTEIEEKIYTGSGTDPVNNLSVIPRAIQAAMATTDPTYDIHVNFNYTAMAMYAVPAITGYAILKGKKSILASFTQGPRTIGKEAGTIAGSGFGLGLINRNIQRLGDQGAYATWAQGAVDGNGRAERARWDGMEEGSAAMTLGGDAMKKGANWGVAASDADTRGRMTPRGVGVKLIGDAAGMYEAYSKKHRSLVTKEYMYDVAKGYALDDDFGTASYSAKQHRVIGGMLDGARRFELEEMEFADGIIKAKHQLFMEKFWTKQEVLFKDTMTAGGAVIGALQKGGFREAPTAAAGGVLASGLGFFQGGANAVRAMDPHTSNVDMYKDQGLMQQAGDFVEASWRPAFGRR